MACRHDFGRVMLGIGVSALPTATRAMSTWMPAGKRAFAQGITHSAARLGNMITPPLVAWIDCASRVARFVRCPRNRELRLGSLWGWYFRDDPADHPCDEGTCRARPCSQSMRSRDAEQGTEGASPFLSAGPPHVFGDRRLFLLRLDAVVFPGLDSAIFSCTAIS